MHWVGLFYELILAVNIMVRRTPVAVVLMAVAPELPLKGMLQNVTLSLLLTCDTYNLPGLA